MRMNRDSRDRTLACSAARLPPPADLVRSTLAATGCDVPTYTRAPCKRHGLGGVALLLIFQSSEDLVCPLVSVPARS